MEHGRLGKQRLVDWIVEKATWGLFKGDKRDGEAPPITIQNFWLEKERYGAKALKRALKRILRLFQTFDFVSEDDRAVALSETFTAVARRGLPFAPLRAASIKRQT